MSDVQGVKKSLSDSFSTEKSSFKEIVSDLPEWKMSL